MFNSIKELWKKYYNYALAILLILLFLVFLCLLVIAGHITRSEFVGILINLSGWVVALSIALIHIRKNREDNLIVQKNEIKKRLEIETFKEINKVIIKNEEILTDISTYYSFTWKLKIKNSIKNKKLNDSEIVLETHALAHIHLAAREQNTRLIELWKNFIISIETYEIVLIRFNKFKEVLNKEFKKVLSMTNDFENYIIRLSRKTLLKEDLATLDEKMSEIDNKIMDISCYLRDYRIELMNSMLGDIFHSKVPKRKAKEPHKTLTQIAKDIYKDS